MKDSSCPCHLFTTPSQLISALKSKEKTEILIDWIIQGNSIEYSDLGFQKRKKSSIHLNCKNHEFGVHHHIPCHNKLVIVYTVLNAIRDACRVYLEGNSNKSGQETSDKKTSQQSLSKSSTLVLSDEDAFPSLASSNLSVSNQITHVLQPKRKVKSNKQNDLTDKKDKGLEMEIPLKRRVRPAQITADQISQSPWAVEVTLSEHMESTSFAVDPMNRVMNSKKIIEKARKSQDPMQRVMSTTKQFSERKVRPVVNTFTQTVRTENEHSKESDGIILDSTVKVYCAIVMSNLVPSLALELQLLIRLLSMNTNDERNMTSAAPDERPLLHELFVDENACRKFACLVLNRLKYIILNLEYNIAISLLNLDAFLHYLPSLAQELELRLDHFRQITIHRTDTNFVSGKNLMLSVPFQESRDSRHNFRSHKLAALYNNREKCRDSFLFQLRAFQQMRGTVLNPTQVQQSLKVIQDSCNQVIQNIPTTNIPWFAEFFVDLLLQIGLVQIEETDDDILKNVRDKDKLQKLHNRFTSKAMQRNKSTNRLVLRESDESDGLGPDHFFTGNQEFFFIFIRYVDSYRFISHLKRRLVDVIMMYLKSTELKHLEQRISELQMLSRFLAYIHHSPNYNLTEESLDVIGSPIIPLHSLIQDAFRDGKLIVTIPLILNFMRMIQWDRISMKSNYYQEVLGMLRSIQKHITRNVLESDCYQINLQLIGFQIDSFFSETIGLSHIELLEIYDLPFQIHHDMSLDLIPFDFAKEFIFSLSLQIDDLCKLITDITVNGGVSHSAGASKKLRPFMLTSRTVSGTNSFLESGYLHLFDRIENERFDADFMNVPTKSHIDNIHDKLVDAFFHQHKELQQLCEFVIDFAIEKILTRNKVREFVSPYAKYILNSVLIRESIPNPMNLEWYIRVLQTAESRTLLQVQLHSNCILKNYIEKALVSLVPTYVDNKVRSMSIVLALQHAYRKAETFNTGTVRKIVKSLLDEQIHPSIQTSVSLGTVTKVSHVTRAIFEAKIVLETFLSESHDGTNDISLNVISSLSTATKNLDSCLKLEDHDFDNDEYKVSMEINALVPLLETSLHRCFQRIDSYGALMVQAIIEVACSFLKIHSPTVSFERIGTYLSTPNILLSLLKWSIQIDVENIFIKCLNGRLITISQFDNGMNQLLDSFNLSQYQALLCMRLMNNTRTYS